MNPIRSAVPEIRWPSLPTPIGASLLALEFQFRFTEASSSQARLALQWRQLTALVGHARETVPFYRDRLAILGSLDAERPDWAAWEAMPLLSQGELGEEAAALHSAAVPVDHGKVQTVLVPAVNGQVVELKDTEINQYFARAIAWRDHLWHQRNFRARFAIIDDSPKVKTAAGVSVAGWGVGLNAAYEVGAAQVLHIDMAVAQQVKWLALNKAEIVTTTPANAEVLAKYCLANAAKVPSLREIRVVGGGLPASLREACQRAWSASLTHVCNVPGVGPIALQCPVSGQLHVQSENALVEVIDEAGKACQPGEIGQLVVTGLHNFAAPLLRYATEHRAEVGGPCSCGRTLPTLRRVM